ncbi:hypothetical protein SDRG_06421 [Saprolegnia diclina VS20]|uniref:Uncharacterized protein n=1 Tax=Saprolegnia diclina (strain VS20) TaxID=1156394 RepID=T0QNL8_SAPDV|nr:hypothetical protein SDRG_06421 [Saprolegnia diclina VS20]EQC36316.1 hypothetical protein SDRG_06421 [Saprolegnia diclina VS20]|eukprot:XP_008610422.1 hypothetical protein SDRG_06421 [Saprolegnia diclina VS20]
MVELVHFDRTSEDVQSRLMELSLATIVWHLAWCTMDSGAIVGRMAMAVQPMWTHVVPSSISTVMALVPAATGSHAVRDHVWMPVDKKSFAVQLFNTTEGPLGDIRANPSTNRLYIVSTNDQEPTSSTAASNSSGPSGSRSLS